MFARRLMPIFNPRNVCHSHGSFCALECVLWLFRPKICSSQRFLLIKGFSINCAALLPRSTHFSYIGDEVQTPRQVNVLAKKSKKKKRIKSAKQSLKDDLEDTLREERLKEDIESTVEMVRKRLHLKEKDIVKLNLNIDYLLSQNIPFTVISKMCDVAPKTITLDMTVLKKRITVFKVNSFFEESLVKILKKNPKILSRDVENTLTVKVEALRRLQFGFSVDEVVSIMERCPSIIEYMDTDNILGKVKFLEEKVGFKKKEVRKVLLKYPAILTMKMTSVKEKVDFCVKNFNTDLDKIAKYPRILQSRFDRLKERCEYLEHEGIIGKDVKIRGWAFKGIAANSDVYFAGKIAHKPLKKLRDFQGKRKQDSESHLETSNSS